MKRVATALIAIPIALLITLYSPGWVFAFAVAVIGGVCFEELLTMGWMRTGVRLGRWIAIVGAVVTGSFMGGVSWVLITVTAAFLVAMTVVALAAPLETALPGIAIGATGILYCGVLPGFIVLLQRDQRESVVVLFGIIWAGDAAAYYAGRAFGQHPLAPLLSPKKTVEGAVAGLAASAIVGTVLGGWMLGGAVSVVTSLVTAGAGQIGDLVESALKRSAGVKDSSSLLPGHGGMLDRLDSLLFAAPVFYWLLKG